MYGFCKPSQGVVDRSRTLSQLNNHRLWLDKEVKDQIVSTMANTSAQTLEAVCAYSTRRMMAHFDRAIMCVVRALGTEMSP